MASGMGAEAFAAAQAARKEDGRTLLTVPGLAAAQAARKLSHGTPRRRATWAAA